MKKYVSGTSSKGKAGAHFQKQMHNSKNFNGGNSYAGQKQFKTGQSWFGKSKAPGMDMTYALGDHQSHMGRSTFKTDTSRWGSQTARESNSTFSGGDNMFKTGSALTRSRAQGKAPHIIETIETTSMKKAAYSEDEVKRLLGR